MFQINENFQRLAGNYLFAEVARRSSEYIAQHPDHDVIRLGIGDVTRPLVPAVVDAITEATTKMGMEPTFHGYGPYEGYDFLLQAIADNDYKSRGAQINPDEIFVSDGSKCDTANIQELFSANCKIAVTDPVYPVYVDTNVMAGRAGAYDSQQQQYTDIEYLPMTADNDFKPELPKTNPDVVYLCSPNNPTGTVMDKAALQKWVDWANQNGTLILFDAAYERFISDDHLPHTIFEIPGAKTCAIEFRSFSKTAGFTGARCAYTVIPKELMGSDAAGNKISINEMWVRRQATKFNGVSYMVQCGAAAIYTPQGKKQIEQVISGYMENARLIREGMAGIGLSAFGGEHSPYIWLKTPDGMKSWDFFDKLLSEAHIVGTPGSGFGRAGEGYFRLTAFNTRENTERAIARLKNIKL